MRMAPPPVPRVEESASLTPDATAVRLPVTTTTDPADPSVTPVVPFAVADDVETSTAMPPPVVLRSWATAVSAPSALTVTLPAPGRLAAPSTTRTSLSSSARVVEADVAVGLLALTAMPPAAID